MKHPIAEELADIYFDLFNSNDHNNMFGDSNVGLAMLGKSIEKAAKTLSSPTGRICRDCYWWGRAWESVCDCIVENEESSQLKFYIKVLADDDQGLEATLVTGPNFGCKHWRGKND